MPASSLGGYGLKQLVERDERPFPLHPTVDRYFPAASIEDARRRLTRALERGDGPGLVIGSAGMGKSLLMQVLAAHFQKRFDIVLLGYTRVCSRRALLQSILFELGLPYQQRDEGRLRFSLLDHLLSSQSRSNDLLLLVDEAQTLSIEQLDELRVLTNLIQGGVPRIRLVIAGAASLEEMFASPELESFSQRLAARSYLSAFSRDETAQFVRAQLAASQAALQDVLGLDACEAVFEATDGVPRLVNQLCDRAISVAVTRNSLRIDRHIVQEAWSDLQQLPTPWDQSSTASSVASSVVEFGSLAIDATSEQPILAAEENSNRASAAHLQADVETPQAPLAQPRAVSPPRPQVNADPLNPFAEEFDEEEVVLDLFAPLLNLGDLHTPRVENLRDPSFSSLVQAALDSVETPVASVAPEVLAEPTRHEAAVTPEIPPDAISSPAADEVERFIVPSDAWSDLDERLDEFDPHWPPIRLPFPAMSEVAESLDRESAWDEPTPVRFEAAEDGAELDPWAEKFHPVDTRHDLGFNGDDEPVLVVEDDAPHEPAEELRVAATPQVRRQDYRRLFSRLRSG